MNHPIFLSFVFLSIITSRSSLLQQMDLCPFLIIFSTINSERMDQILFSFPLFGCRDTCPRFLDLITILVIIIRSSCRLAVLKKNKTASVCQSVELTFDCLVWRFLTLVQLFGILSLISPTPNFFKTLGLRTTVSKY